VVDCVKQRKIVPLTMVRTLNDFRLMQLSWIFDVSYTEALRLAVRREYVRQISSFLPDTEDVKEIVRFLSELLIRKVVCDED